MIPRNLNRPLSSQEKNEAHSWSMRKLFLSRDCNSYDLQSMVFIKSYSRADEKLDVPLSFFGCVPASVNDLDRGDVGDVSKFMNSHRQIEIFKI